MLLGLGEEEDQRQARQRKSTLYKQMLDHQILMNQQYKKQHSQGGTRPLHPKEKEPSLSGFMPTVVYEPTQDLQRSLVTELQMVRGSRYKPALLPKLQDKNTFYRGSSTYLKVQSNLPFKAPRYHTQAQIQQKGHQQQQTDQYQSTCQRIIKQLQQIKSKPIKFRTKRKLHNGSSMLQHKKMSQQHSTIVDNYRSHTQHTQTKLSFPLYSNNTKQKQKTTQVQYSSISTDQGNRNRYDPQLRYNQFISTQNKIQESNNRKNNKKVAFVVSGTTEYRKQGQDKMRDREGDRGMDRRGNRGGSRLTQRAQHNTINDRNKVQQQLQQQQNQFVSVSCHPQPTTHQPPPTPQPQTNQKQQSEAIPFAPKTNTNHQSSSKILKPQQQQQERQLQQQKQRKQQHQRQQKQQQQQKQRRHVQEMRRVQQQRTAFVQLLRKVKTRGHSLYSKLAAPKQS